MPRHAAMQAHAITCIHGTKVIYLGLGLLIGWLELGWLGVVVGATRRWPFARW